MAVFWLQTAGMVAGWCELEKHEQEVQVAYFGLLPPFVGKGWGRFWLDWTIRKAWQPAPRRVWVHTCDHDHPAALPLYKKLAFVPYRTEELEHTGQHQQSQQGAGDQAADNHRG